MMFYLGGWIGGIFSFFSVGSDSMSVRFEPWDISLPAAICQDLFGMKRPGREALSEQNERRRKEAST